jgi:hypothetical protein
LGRSPTNPAKFGEGGLCINFGINFGEC